MELYFCKACRYIFCASDKKPEMCPDCASDKIRPATKAEAERHQKELLLSEEENW